MDTRAPAGSALNYMLAAKTQFNDKPEGDRVSFCQLANACRLDVKRKRRSSDT